MADILGPKIWVFLRYSYKVPFFVVGRTQPQIVIMRPHPKVTLGTFGFAVHANLATPWAVFQALFQILALFGDSQISKATTLSFAPRMMKFSGNLRDPKKTTQNEQWRGSQNKNLRNGRFSVQPKIRKRPKNPIFVYISPSERLKTPIHLGKGCFFVFNSLPVRHWNIASPQK